MSTSNDGGSTAGVGGMTLEEFVGDAFGDVGASLESEPAGAGESPGSEAGQPPASSPDPSAGTPEGAPSAEHAGQPPAVAADATPDSAALAAQPTGAVDPLAGATPLTYTVNGQQRTFDEIKVLGEHGAIIPAEHLPKVQQRLSQYDNLFEQNRQRHQAYQDLERLTSWQTKDAQGTTHTLTGRDAIMEQRSVTARSLAVNDVLVRALQDPKVFASLVAVVDDGAGNPVLTIDEQARQALFTQAELAAVKADQRARMHVATLGATAPTTPPAERPIAELAPAAVDANLKALGLTNLPADSRQFLIEQLPRYVRPSTAEERAADPSIGPRIVDYSFVALIKREAQTAATARTVADKATAAGKSNAAALAAAALGARGKPQTPAASSARPNAPANADAEMWARRERAALGSF